MHLSSNSKIQMFDPKPIQVSKRFSWNKCKSVKCCFETIIAVNPPRHHSIDFKWMHTMHFMFYVYTKLITN